MFPKGSVKMIDGSEKRSFELQNSCDFEKRRDLISLVCFAGWLHVELHAGHTKTIRHSQTGKTVNTRNISGMLSRLQREKPIRREKITLSRFCGQFPCPDLCCDWS